MTEVRAGTRDDDPGIRALLAEVFPENPKVDVGLFNWQYRDNPFGEAHTWVAVEDRRVVAHYAGIAVPLVVDGRPVPGSIGVDAATAPSHRGRGLFEELARSLYSSSVEQGRPLVLCFPNPNSRRGFVKAGGAELGIARSLVQPLDAAWLGARLHLPAGMARPLVSTMWRRRGPAGTEVDLLPADAATLWRQQQVRSGIVRDEEWFDWRYRRRPDTSGYRHVAVRASGQLTGIGTLVVRDHAQGKIATVLEGLATDADAAGRVAMGLADIARAAECVALAWPALSGSTAWRTARMAGLRPLPQRFEPQPLVVGVADAGRMLTGERLGWNLWWGDLDHV